MKYNLYTPNSRLYMTNIDLYSMLAWGSMNQDQGIKFTLKTARHMLHQCNLFSIDNRLNYRNCSFGIKHYEI